MIFKQAHVALIVSFVCEWIRTVSAHGRLWTPPGRSTMWRQGWKTPINYNDMQLFCGGFDHQVSLGYKCGLCGDPYDEERENETGGKYATGTITETYHQGQKITVQVDLTAAHKGYFEFKVCARDDPNVKETQECFDLHLLGLADGSGSKYYPEGSSMLSIDVSLPEGLTCKYCVLQWRYHTGNSWGVGPEGGCVGCGPQEEFYGCADFRILPSKRTNYAEPNPGFSPLPSNETSTHSPVTPPTAPTPRRFTNCEGKYRQTSLDSWCRDTCEKGSCSRRHCSCPQAGQKTPRVCKPEAGSSQTLDRCTVNCVAGYCPYSHCECS